MTLLWKCALCSDLCTNIASDCILWSDFVSRNVIARYKRRAEKSGYSMSTEINAVFKGSSPAIVWRLLAHDSGN